MKLTSREFIQAPPSEVWKVLSDPNLMELWNPKCVRSAAGKGPFGLGFRFQASFKLGSRPEQTHDCELIEYEFESSLAIRYTGPEFKKGGHVVERYRLLSENEGTLIRQELDLAHSELPYLVRLLMKFINRFGYSVNAGPLDGIKYLAEKSEAEA